ncbi:MAG: type IX secretion system membrane protein PorP/SprF [Bacteroidota bacterium]
MPRVLSVVFVLMWVGIECWAQDPQFSQYYSAPLNLNPGLTGINQKGRVGLNYRNQWPAIDATFETYSFWVDYNFEDYYSSVGLLVNVDREGIAGLTSNMVGLNYAYQLQLNYEWTFRPAVQIAWIQRDINFDRLTFGDQFDANGQVVLDNTRESFNTGQRANMFDLSFGGIVFNENLWAGLSVYHVTEPNQSLVDADDSPLYMRTSIHGGYRIHFYDVSSKAQNRPDRERSFTPSFNYRSQAEFDQLDLGVFVTLEPVLFGVWYRGIPVKNLESIPNNESIIFMAGLNNNNFSIGYSFDFTISDLGINSGGAHEISLIYTFSLDPPGKPPKSVRDLKCPVPFIF